MRFLPCLYLLLVFMISCGKDSSGGSTSSSGNQVVTVPEVQAFLAEMNEYIIVYLNGTAVNNIIFKYTDSDSNLETAGARGRCDKSGATPQIILYRADWIGPYSADNVMKKASFYHLMGHCVFNKSHNNEQYYYEDGRSQGARSFMHSNFGYSLFAPPPYGSSTTLTTEKLVDLQREFFNYYGPL